MTANPDGGNRNKNRETLLNGFVSDTAMPLRITADDNVMNAYSDGTSTSTQNRIPFLIPSAHSCEYLRQIIHPKAIRIIMIIFLRQNNFLTFILLTDNIYAVVIIK